MSSSGLYRQAIPCGWLEQRSSCSQLPLLIEQLPKLQSAATGIPNCAPPQPAPRAPKQNSVFRSSTTGENSGWRRTGASLRTNGDGTTTLPPPPGTAAPGGRG